MEQRKRSEIQMSDVENQEGVEESAGGEAGKVVPVSESIKYRKRAQQAEKENEEMARELEQVREEHSKVRSELGEVKLERRLVDKLAAAGAKDMEAALVLAKSRIKGGAERDVDGVVDELRKEKGYLFFEGDIGDVAGKTRGGRSRFEGGRGRAAGAAKQAVVSGSRRDVHEYMRLRRSGK